MFSSCNIILIFFCFGAFSFKERDYILPRPSVYTGVQTKSKFPIYFSFIYNNHDDERGTFFFRERSLKSDIDTTIVTKRCDALNFCSTEVVDTLYKNSLHVSSRYVKPQQNNDSFLYQVEGASSSSSQFFSSIDLEDLESSLSGYWVLGLSNPNASIYSVDIDKQQIKGFDPEYGNFVFSFGENNQENTEFFYYLNYTSQPYFVTPLLTDILTHGVENSSSPACCYPWNHQRKLPNADFTLLNDQQTKKSPNLVIIQKVLKTPFQWTVQFESIEQQQQEQRNTKSLTTTFNELYDKFVKEFEELFSSKFPVSKFLENNMWLSSKEQERKNEEEKDWKEFGLRVFSSLMSGLSYYEGISYYKNNLTGPIIQEKKDKKLLSFVPCKKGFSHPFYWDESFHEMVVLRMYPHLSAKIFQYWADLSKLHDDGWIAREQIIGNEALETTPEWAYGDPTTSMNPPSFYLTFQQFFKLYETNTSSSSKDLLDDIYDDLVRTAAWYFENMENSDYYSFGFAWNGRTGDGTYDSGLDDFPRTYPPKKTELNVDAQSWILMMTKVMKDLSILRKNEEKAKFFEMMSEQISKQLFSLFWNEDLEFYFDVETENKHVENIGVVGVLPLCLALEQNETRFDKILDKITNEQHLFDPNGILSLSKSNKWFDYDGNYWRGNIWINQQYLCLRALDHYANNVYPHKKEKLESIRKYFELKLATMMYENNEREKGGIYETYHPFNGLGYNHLPFVGWSSLILLIMSEDYR